MRLLQVSIYRYSIGRPVGMSSITSCCVAGATPGMLLPCGLAGRTDEFFCLQSLDFSIIHQGLHLLCVIIFSLSAHPLSLRNDKTTQNDNLYDIPISIPWAF